jgi:hypothetical protein
MAFYSKAQIDSLERFLAEDAVFEDPSHMLHGRTEFISKLKTSLEGFVFERYDIHQWIPSGRHHILAIGVLTFTQQGRDKTLRFETPLAVGLKIVDGKVARHVDYVDLRVYMEQLEAQR